MSLEKNAQIFCEENGHRLTDPRRYVLGIIGKAKKPIVAYDVLAELAKKMDNPKPPTVYRAIEFWQTHGFVHRIESVNAYIACHAGHRHDGSQYMICSNCGDVQEIHVCSTPQPFAKKAEAAGFALHHWNAELHGLCGSCASG